MNTERVLHADETAFFDAPVVTIGINLCVVVPESIVRALLAVAKKRAAPVPVRATLNGHPFEANVVRYGGAWRLYLHGTVRAGAGVAAGDAVRIGLTYDPADRMPPLPEGLQRALADDERRKAAWRLQPGARRKAILAYLQECDATTLDRAVERVIEHVDRKTLARFTKEIAPGER